MRRNDGTRASPPRRLEGGERVLDRAVEPRQLAEEGVVVIGEAVGDLVDHLEPGLAQHVGAPQDQHGAPQLLLDRRQLGGVAAGAVALVEQVGDLEFAGQRALAAHLGRMRGQHRAHQRAVEECARAPRASTPISRVRVKGVGERAGARRGAGRHMGAVAADVVLVLGDVGEMREIAEGAHDRERLVGRQAVEHRLQLAPRAGLVVAMEADRGLPDLLDELVGLLALLLAHRVAEDAAEQPDVVAQRPVLFVRRGRRRLRIGRSAIGAPPSRGRASRMRADCGNCRQVGRSAARDLTPLEADEGAAPAPRRAPRAPRSFSSHSWTTTARQPIAASAARVFSSRARLRAILARQ